jgi:acyl transferase domain-containing protein
MDDSRSLAQSSIAIIGMAARFPGARDIDEFWRNLSDGVESIRPLTDAQLLAAGVAPAELSNPAYVKAAAVLDDIDLFDAAFFGFSAKDAAIMDPQHRVFLECAWNALEHSGWAVDQFEGRIGVYAGSGMNTYLIHNLLANRRLVGEAGLFVLKQTGNDKDVLATRISYQLNLTGPSLTVQTACSTSLVAVHLASQALLNGECDMALAGGVTIEIPHGRGYVHRDGEILSRDGHCRPFDADSSGTIFASGAGMVVLRRLEDALRDRDTIHAIIRGSAINNDGSRKVGFLAPSVAGQSEVIQEALAAAGVEADSISYVEAHGTGTKVGDPIEIQALTQAFRQTSNRRGFCAIGALKASVGHLDAAAGVAGLIKTALSLEHHKLPPSLNYRSPNPLIDFADSPFFVNDRLSDWTVEHGVRRAGVTSLGIGGTNAHVIVEEPPIAGATSPPRSHELLTLSAKTPGALDAMTRRLADYLDDNVAPLDDVAFTCHLGRAALQYRRAIVCAADADTAATVRRPDQKAAVSGVASGREPETAFLFSGQGAQYPGMGRALYTTSPEFKSIIDYCCDFLKPLLGIDLRLVIFPSDDAADVTAVLAQTRLTQPALFVIEYALAKLWMSLGIQPAAMIGHSIGEFAAACVAGVFSLDDTLRIVAERGRLMQSLPSGAMLAVAATESEVAKLLDGRCAIGSVNAENQCAVSGPEEAIKELELALAGREVFTRRLKVSHAFHSPMMDPVVEPFAAFVNGFDAHPPSIKWVSSATGEWITADQACQGSYWARQLRGTVRFHDGISTLLKSGVTAFLEVGPGHTLTALAAQHPGGPEDLQTINTLPGPAQDMPADASFLRAIGSLWVSGAKIDWRRYHRGESRDRVPLPTYPFERRRFWIDPDPAVLAPTPLTIEGVKSTGGDGVELFRPLWREADLPTQPGFAKNPTGPWLIFADTRGLGDRIAGLLRDRGEEVVLARAGNAFLKRDGGEFEIATSSRADYDELVSALRGDGKIPRRIVHLWNLTDSNSISEEVEPLVPAMAACFWSILFFAQAFAGEAEMLRDGRLAIGSNRCESPEGEACENPLSALLTGPCGVIPRELPHLRCRHIDFALPDQSANGNRNRALEEIAFELVAEIDGVAGDSPVAYRRGRRLVRSYERLVHGREPIKLRDGAVHVITGGLGGIGLTLAKVIAEQSRPNLVLIARHELPPRDEWAQRIARGGRWANALRQVEELEGRGAQVMTIAADVADEAAMREALSMIHGRFGAVTGVIHAAGIMADAPLLTKSASDAAAVLAAKVQGTQVIERVFGDEPLEYLILCSSISSIIAPAGQIDYAAANAFLDAYARSRSAKSSYPVVSLQFPRWSDVGMAAEGAADQALPALNTDGGSNRGRHEIVHETSLSLVDDWIVGEHRTREGVGVFPGTGFIEMIAQAAKDLIPLQLLFIRDLQFKVPIQVRPNEHRSVRIALGPHGTEYQFTASMETESGWVECATARLVQSSADSTASYDLAALRRQCSEREMVFAYRQNRLQEKLFEYGPRWHTLDRISFGRGEGLVHLELAPEFNIELGDYSVHPALLDMATGSALFLIPDYEKLGRAYVPIGYGRISIRKALTSRCYSYLRIHPSTAEGAQIVTFDADVLDEDGNVLVEIREFMMSQVHGGLTLDPQRTAAREAAASLPAGTALDQKPNESISSLEGAALFRRVVAGAQGANLVAFRGDFVAFERSHRVSAEPRGAHGARGGALEDEIERTLAEWWQELLGAESLTSQSDFFQLGGQSLTAVRLLARIKQTYGAELSSAVIFEAPTIEKLARLIRNGSTPAVLLKSAGRVVWTAGAEAQPNRVHSAPKIAELRQGSPRSFFFVHDGEGETLLYLNLARRMPGDLGVYAIEPRRLARVPLGHATIEEMAASYIEQVREKQPQGPYLLSGLCAGGTIAYEMASQLDRAGERVELLVLLDAAMPGAAERPGLLGEQRRLRLKQALADITEAAHSPLKRTYLTIATIAKKSVGALRWEVSHRVERLWVRARYRLLCELLKRQVAWPRLVPELRARQIYDCALTLYTPKPLSIPGIVLVRAQTGEGGDDTPFREIFADEALGWRAVADKITCVDVDGGHSTMLQERFVDSLATALLPYLLGNAQPVAEVTDSRAGIAS